MTPEEFRTHAHAFVDWMADYLAGVERYPVRSRAAPGEIAARLPDAPPDEAEPVETIFRDFEEIVMPGVTHWQHPGFFAFFPAGSSPPSVLAEMLTATLGVQGMIWQTSPAATELETRMLDWLRRMTGLPEGFAGVIQDTASTATLCALLTARERATAGLANVEGLCESGRLAVYCSEEAHSSVEKDVRIAGLGSANLRKIPVDDGFGMVPEALEEAMEADTAEGCTPACVIATLGTTGASGFDPLRPIGEICKRHGAFLHVDAAWAGSALVLPEERWMIDGIEYADSFLFNPHKWLFTNFDCTAHFVRDPGALVRALSISPEYLRTAADDAVINYRDWGIQLGRRFRALKLWFVIRAYGVAGLRERIAAHIAMARNLAGKLDAEADFELMAPARLALFCFRHRPVDMDDTEAIDRHNERLIEALNASGALYLTHTRIGGAYAIRLCVGQLWTEQRHIDEAWTRIRETARAMPSPEPEGSAEIVPFPPTPGPRGCA